MDYPYLRASSSQRMRQNRVNYELGGDCLVFRSPNDVPGLRKRHVNLSCSRKWRGWVAVKLSLLTG